MIEASPLPSTSSHIIFMTHDPFATMFFITASVRFEFFKIPLTGPLPGGDDLRGNITLTPGSARSFKSRMPAGLPFGTTRT